MAQGLTVIGVRHLTLLDPDVLKVHNLGEMVRPVERYLGQSKAAALASHLTAAFPWPQSVPVVASVTARRALAHLLECDVLCACGDNDGARLAAGSLATLYLKPLPDMSTAP